MDIPSKFAADMRTAQQLEEQRRRDPRACVGLIQIYRRVIKRLQLEKYPLFYASIHHRLGLVYCELKSGDSIANLHRAIACYQQALRIWTPEAAPLDYAKAQFLLAGAYSNLPEEDRIASLNQMITSYEEALRIWTPETIPTSYALTQFYLGSCYGALRTGDREVNLQRAISCYQQALRIWTPETAPLNYARAQHNLGDVYYYMSMVSEDHAIYDRWSNYSCWSKDSAVNIQRAIACYQEALRFLTAETAPLDYATIQYDLGLVYSQLPTGEQTVNIQRAIACYQEALRIYKPETFPLDYGRTQLSLGNIYLVGLTGRGREAKLRLGIACFQEALRILTAETNPLAHANAQLSLGNAYIVASELLSDEVNSQQAITCFQQASNIWTPETAPLDYARAQNCLGHAYRKLSTGDHEANLRQAIACHQEALRFLTIETYPPGYSKIQSDLGSCYRELRTGDHEANLQRAVAHYQEALRIEGLIEVTSGYYRHALEGLARVYIRQGEWHLAFSTYSKSIELGEHLYRIGLLAESKETLIYETFDLYPEAAFAAVRCGKTNEALLILERGKARHLSETLRLGISRPANLPDEVWKAFEGARAAVRMTQTMKITVPGQEHNQMQAYTELERDIRDANVVLDGAIEDVRLYAPKFLQSLDLPTLQAVIPDKQTALVAFCITEQGSLGFVVSHHSRQIVQTVEVPTFSQAVLDDLVGNWFAAYIDNLAESSSATFVAWQTAVTHTLAILGQHLLFPILSALSSSIKKIIFLPSGKLSLLPIHAAPLSGNSELVCDCYQVSYVPSIDVLTTIRARAMQKATSMLYAIINPQADPQLVFTLVERTALAKLFAQSEIDEGRVGTKQRVITKALGHSYVHFSCHASYNWLDPMQSGLDLADGRLTVAELQDEIVNLSDTCLITLSACETGIVDVIKESPEEYVGLPAGFLLAGVPCVISSLWAVPDLSTALLMERFYRNHLIDSMGFAAALQEAQVWLRELSIGEVATFTAKSYQSFPQKEVKKRTVLFMHMLHYRYLAGQDPTSRPFAHPYYWAAFTVNGW